MPRAKRSIHARKKRRKVLEQAKGYRGTKHASYKRAKEQVQRSGQYAYRDRRVRKREFRKLWIVRINAGARENGLSYNAFMPLSLLRLDSRRGHPQESILPHVLPSCPGATVLNAAGFPDQTTLRARSST